MKSALTFTCNILLLLFFISLVFVAVNSQTDSCNINFNFNDLVKFDTTSLSCQSVWQLQDFILRYKKVNSNTWSFVLSAPNKGGYVAIGFSSNGAMIGSSAMVGWPENGSTGMIKQYYLRDKSPSEVEPDQGALKLVANSTAVVIQSSRIYVAFQLATSQPSDQLIFAMGSPSFQPRSPNYQLQQHMYETSTELNYASGQVEVQSSPYTGLKRAHGAINMLSWGILVPLGTLIARYFRRWDPIWFYSHVAIQILGFILGLTGVILGFVLEGLIHAGDIVTHHKRIGIAVLVLGCLQVTALLARPEKGSKARQYWNWYHHFAGRILIVLAVANIFYGIRLAHEAVSWSLSYGLIVAILAIAGVFLEMKLRRED